MNKYGIPEEDAKICTDVLLESDRRGIESHGVNRFKPIYLDRIKAGIQKPVTNFEIVKETETTAVVDGHDGMGQVIGYKSMQMAIDKAKKYGMGMVVVRNSCHYGIAGYYTSMATKAGLHRHDRHQRPSLRRAHLRRLRGHVRHQPAAPWACPRTSPSISTLTAPPPSPRTASSNTTSASAKRCIPAPSSARTANP